MGETTNEVGTVGTLNRTTAEAAEAGPEAAQIRSNIEQTRSDLSDTINALQEKLDPARIAEQVKDQIREKAADAYDSAKTIVKEATIGKAEKIMANVSDTVSDITGRAGAAVKESSSSFVQYIRENPVPFALLGAGIGMLAWNARRGQESPYGRTRNVEPDDYRYGYGSSSGNLSGSGRDVAGSVAETARAATDRAKDALTSAAGTVREAASTAVDTTRQQFNYVTEQTRQGARIAGDRFNSMLQENPLAVGVAALAAGAVIGLSLPGTRVEDEYMGKTRDRLVDQAKSVAQEAAGKVRRVTEQAGQTVKQAAEKEGLTLAQEDHSPTA